MNRMCFVCKRVGERGFHQVLWGKNMGQWRCNAEKACNDRVYNRWHK